MTPREVLLTIEDNIDHPPHVIHPRLVDMALGALESAGYVIVAKEPTEKMKEAACGEGYSGEVWPEDMVTVFRAMVRAA